MFFEARKIGRHMVSKIVCELWHKCSKRNYTFKAWSAAILIPIYKNEEKSSPHSYRPIAVLSQVRNIVEPAEAMMIRIRYKFRDAQLGFRRGTRTETAVVTHLANAETMKITAAPDQRSTSDTVVRDLLFLVVKKVLNIMMAILMALWIKPVLIKTRGYETAKTVQAVNSVCQMSQFSLNIFNIYVNTYINWTEKYQKEHRVPGDKNDGSVTFLADDAKLQTRDKITLQAALTASTE